MRIASAFTLSMLVGAQALACPGGTTAKAGQVEGKDICVIKGTLSNADITLTNNFAYVLEGDVRIGGDNTGSSKITMEAGTTIYGSPGSYMVISRGSQIFANGTAAAPVVMTALDRVNPTPGYWGGLVITGNAPLNNCTGANAPVSCDNIVEGVQTNAPKYGGNNPDDNSGVINYLRAEYGGFTLSADNELNNITFYAVGAKTQVDYIEAYKGADDGIELFGGNVNLKHVVSIDNDDDGFDWDSGWSGNVQYMLVELENATEADPNGIEADNQKSPMTAMPRSNPTIANATIIAKGNNPKLLNGIMLRRGTAAQIYNTIVKGTFQFGINIDDAETFNNGGVLAKDGSVQQTNLVMQNSIVAMDNGVNFKDDAADAYLVSAWFNAPNRDNLVIDPQLKDWSPLSDSPALETGISVPSKDVYQWVNGDWKSAPFFAPVDFIGAFNGSASGDWTAGWTVR
jgi:hypothetical protein